MSSPETKQITIISSLSNLSQTLTISPGTTPGVLATLLKVAPGTRFLYSGKLLQTREDIFTTVKVGNLNVLMVVSRNDKEEFDLRETMRELRKSRSAVDTSGLMLSSSGLMLSSRDEASGQVASAASIHQENGPNSSQNVPHNRSSSLQNEPQNGLSSLQNEPQNRSSSSQNEPQNQQTPAKLNDSQNETLESATVNQQQDPVESIPLPGQQGALGVQSTTAQAFSTAQKFSLVPITPQKVFIDGKWFIATTGPAIRFRNSQSQRDTTTLNNPIIAPDIILPGARFGMGMVGNQRAWVARIRLPNLDFLYTIFKMAIAVYFLTRGVGWGRSLAIGGAAVLMVAYQAGIFDAAAVAPIAPLQAPIIVPEAQLAGPVPPQNNEAEVNQGEVQQDVDQLPPPQDTAPIVAPRRTLLGTISFIAISFFSSLIPGQPVPQPLFQ